MRNRIVHSDLRWLRSRSVAGTWPEISSLSLEGAFV